MRLFRILLVGCSNAGKTTLLNSLAGIHLRTENYPGTTVDIQKVQIEYQSKHYEIVDLPGTYSLTPYSDEEKITREVLLENDFDIVVQVVEPENKKASLCLTIELMEMGVPLVLLFNLRDKAQDLNEKLKKKIWEYLHVRSIFLDAREKKSTKEVFLDEIISNALLRDYTNVLGNVHRNISKEIKEINSTLNPPSLWHSLKILEDDADVINEYPAEQIKKLVLEKNLNTHCEIGEGCESVIRRNRYQFVEQYLEPYIKRKSAIHEVSDLIDRVFIHPLFGVPLFLFIMWGIFEITFTLGVFPSDLIDAGFVLMQEALNNVLPNNIWRSIFVDGIIGGVGATLVFLPPILILFFCLSILQQSGYLSRIAYLLDGFMRKINLQGKSFVPLLMGFGCNVPAIMAVRTLGEKKEKIITALMIPFMSCGARLPVYTLLIAAFFDVQWRGTILFGLYLTGVLMAFLSGVLLNKVLKGNVRALLLEMPDYKIPLFSVAFSQTLEKAKIFLFRILKVILPFTVLLWALFTFPQNPIDDSSPRKNSYAESIGRFIEPVFEPLGFDWRISTGLLAGLGAKEVLVTSMATLYSISEEDDNGLINALREDEKLSPLVALSLLVFMLLYAPCVAVLATIKQEIGLRWAVFALIYPTVVAWICAFLVFQGGSFIN